jgi:hypothetical protein
MRQTHLLWLGAAGALAVVVFALPSARRESRGPSPAPPRVSDLRIDQLVVTLDQMTLQLERLEQLGNRLEAIESGLAASGESPGAALMATPSAEHERLLEDLYQGAKELSADPRQRASAIDAWALFAENTTDAQRRAEAWFEQAKLSDQGMAAELLAKVIETVGLESAVGQKAAHLLGYCQHGNISESLRIWQHLAATPGLPKDVAVRTRMMVANMSVTHGDDEIAIQEYDRLIADYQGDPDEKCHKMAQVAAAIRKNVIARLRDEAQGRR